MEFQLDPASSTPLYKQIVDQIRRRIAQGVLRSGDRLPAVRDLAVRSRVNRNTAARAFQELEAAGIVRSRVGQGTFVADGVEKLPTLGKQGLKEAAGRFRDEAEDWSVSLVEALEAVRDSWAENRNVGREGEEE